ncbi:MAG: 50S ribosomal protein L24 [Verrucomicrobiota bacterium]
MFSKWKKKKAPSYGSFHVKRGDEVKVICGANRGQSGKVLQVLKKKNRVIVEGVNMMKKHTRKNPNNPKGGIEEREGSLHISNVVVVTKGDAKANAKAEK